MKTCITNRTCSQGENRGEECVGNPCLFSTVGDQFTSAAEQWSVLEKLTVLTSSFISHGSLPGNLSQLSSELNFLTASCYLRSTVVCLQRAPTPSADSPMLRHQEPATAVPLNLLAGDTANSSDLGLPTPNEMELLLTCKKVI
ncbi:uncharacterized protein VK521_003660 isoform 2-T2 [Ammospiza maritima maritima]